MAAATKFILTTFAAIVAACASAQQASETLPLGAPSARGGGAEILGGSGSITTTIASTLAVVGMIVLLAAIYRWMSAKAGGLAGQIGAAGKSPSGLVSVLARYPLGRGQTLVLLRLDRRVLLLCQSSSGRVRGGVTTRTLSEISDPEEVASIIAKAEGTGFEGVLRGYESMEPSAGAPVEVEVVDLTRRRGRLMSSLLGKGAA